MPQRSPSRSRSWSQDHSESRHSRNQSPFSRSPSRRQSRSPEAHARDNGRSPSRSRSRRSRSDSRVRDFTRSPSRTRARSITRSASPQRSAKIVIEKLTKNVKEAHLREIFGAFGEIIDIDMPMNPAFNVNRGTAYILYASPSAAEAAISHFHEGQLDSSTLNVSIVLPRRRLSRTPPRAAYEYQPPVRDRDPYPRRRGGGPPLGPRGGYRDRSYSPPPRRGPPRSPPPPRGPYGRGYAGRGPPQLRGGDTYYPNGGGGRNYGRSRSPPPPRRTRSPYSSSRSPPTRRRDDYGYGGAGSVRRRRSPSYSSYGSRSRSPRRR